MEQELFVSKQQIDRMNKKKSIFLALLISASVLFVLSIPLIVVMAVNVIIAGIIIFSLLCFFLFYSIPIGWSLFYLFIKKRQFFLFIVNSQMTSIDDIVRSTGKSKRSVIRSIRSLIKAGYLHGWKLSNDNNEITPLQEFIRKCPNCNAPVSTTEKICGYCGIVIRK